MEDNISPSPSNTKNKNITLEDIKLFYKDRFIDFTRLPSNRYDNINIMSEWISLSDFYNQEWMPHIIYFESFQDLSNKLSSTNLVEISNSMKSFNLKRSEIIYSEWKKILDEIDEKFNNR
jgi:hypothetical protein